MSKAKSKKKTKEYNDLQDFGYSREDRIIKIAPQEDQGGEAEINAITFNNVFNALRILMSDSHEPISIYINTVGGDYDHGLAIYDLIQKAKNDVHVTTIAMGMCASTGTLLLQAGHVRLAAPSSTLMIHPISITMTDTPIVSAMNSIKKDMKIFLKMVEIYAKHSKKSLAFWKRKLSDEFNMTADEALALGFIDGILK